MNEPSNLDIANRIIASPDLLRVKPLMRERCGHLAELMADGGYAKFAPPLVSEVMWDGFAAVAADEGTLWLADSAREHLLPVFNNGPNADHFVGTFRQPLDKGLVSMVYASEQSFCEDEVYRNTMQAGELDHTLQVLTCSMMITPVVFAGRTRGVVSCVKLKPASERDAPDPPGFSGDCLRSFNNLADVIGSLLDGHLMQLCFGVE